MLSNAYFLAKFRFDTAENEPAKNLQNFAKKKLFLLGLLLGTFKDLFRRSASQRYEAPSVPSSFRRMSRLGRRHDGRSAKFRQNVARFRLYRHRFLQQNMRFAAFFKIYQILKLKFLKFGKILQILRHNDLQIFC